MFAGMNTGATPSLAPHHMALIPPERLAEIQKEYFAELAHIATNPEAIEVKDRRFAGKAWHSSWSKVIAATYLLNSKHLMALAKAVDTDEKSKQKILFTTEQMIDALSPSNFIATNPEVLENIISTQGQSIQKGIVNLLGDMKKGKVSITDETAFEVGKNIATTEGYVVFRNELFELIQYTPLTETVFERPYLMVPPCINKYYILDLQPDNSVVRHMVSQGHTVFLVSWKNPDSSMAQVSWDDYVGKGVIKAIEVVKDIGNVDQLNVLGFCVGGTILSTALAVLAGPSAFASDVYIVPGSEVNLVARDGRIPVTIKNDGSESATIIVHGKSSTFRLEVLKETELTIPAGSSQVAEVGVRAVANGPVELEIWLEENGAEVGKREIIQVNVNYDVELFLLVSFAFAMFGLILIGSYRTVRKLRRSRNG